MGAVRVLQPRREAGGVGQRGPEVRLWLLVPDEDYESSDYESSDYDASNSDNNREGRERRQRWCGC